MLPAGTGLKVFDFGGIFLTSTSFVRKLNDEIVLFWHFSA